jgi:hypothetical protein
MHTQFAPHLCKRMLGAKLLKKAAFDTDFETRTLPLAHAILLR